MYNDNTILTVGKYKFIALCRVPADFLLRMYTNKGYYNAELKEYIESNIEKIILRNEGLIITPPLDFPCEKLFYANRKIAKGVLRKIASMKQEHKKPIRVYECEKCGGWHLTSMPLEEWQKASFATSD